MKKKYISILMCVIMLSFVGCGKTTGIEELDNTTKSPKENTVNDQVLKLAVVFVIRCIYKVTGKNIIPMYVWTKIAG